MTALAVIGNFLTMRWCDVAQFGGSYCLKVDYCPITGCPVVFNSSATCQHSHFFSIKERHIVHLFIVKFNVVEHHLIL